MTLEDHARDDFVKNTRLIDELMAENSDLTSRQLYSAFKEAYPVAETSLSTVKRARQYLGWTSKHTRYCQLISEVNNWSGA